MLNGAASSSFARAAGDFVSAVVAAPFFLWRKSDMLYYFVMAEGEMGEGSNWEKGKGE